MTSYKEIKENGDREFTLVQISEALRTTKQCIYLLCRTKKLPYVTKNINGRDTMLVTGGEVMKYLAQFNESL